MHKGYTIFILLWMPIGILFAQFEGDLQKPIDRFRAGQRVWNAQAMEAARAEFAMVARENPETYAPLYWQSVSEFYLMLCYGLEDSSGYDPDRARALLDPAEQTMKAAIAVHPEEAECHAMLSSVVGFRIMFHPFSALWNGPKVLSLQGDALSNEPDNPRVLYIIGAGYFRAPRLFRNVEKAEDLLLRAQKQFERTPQNNEPSQPRWGRAECYGLLGDLRLEQGDQASARSYYNQAIRINPAYIPAQRRLKEMANEK